MSNENNIQVVSTSDLQTLLQSMGDHVIPTINLEGDDENAEE